MTPRLNFTGKTFDSKELKNGKSFLLVRPSVFSPYLVKAKVSTVAIGFLRFEQKISRVLGSLFPIQGPKQKTESKSCGISIKRRVITSDPTVRFPSTTCQVEGIGEAVVLIYYRQKTDGRI